MKLGDVLKKERERKRFSLEETASKLGLAQDRYQDLEAGGSPAEKWGPLLAQVAIKLETPTSRLLADSGKSTDARPGQAGQLIRSHRERRSKTVDEMAEQLAISRQEYEEIEAGKSGIEEYGPLLLHFAELIEQPVFNLFYPCGLPLDKLEVNDYP
ncbi:MAG TPA: helix-turn-helix domain-containing protein [Thermoanaerobaculia bacterium]|nr:helix-turn-helix domain-containing protein [Thermoanaerobaculia bacterium]